MSRSSTMDKRKKFLKKADGTPKPPKPGTRKKIWVRGHTVSGRKVKGRFRKAPKK